MDRFEQFRQQALHIFSQYPRITQSKCVRALAYQHPTGNVRYCFICYEAARRPSHLVPTTFHGFLDGKLSAIPCSLCQANIISTSEAVSCLECFAGYMQLIGHLRATGIDYRDVSGVLYDNMDREIIKIYIRRK